MVSQYRFKVRTLEEAEQEMEGGLHARQAMANSRLAALVANGEQPSEWLHAWILQMGCRKLASGSLLLHAFALCLEEVTGL